jgi:hypothetical protein
VPSVKRNLEFDIVAAAQWVIWPDDCRDVYQECREKEATTHSNYWEPFSKQNWERWKQEFEIVVASELYDDETKAVARQARGQMGETDKYSDED